MEERGRRRFAALQRMQARLETAHAQARSPAAACSALTDADMLGRGHAGHRHCGGWHNRVGLTACTPESTCKGVKRHTGPAAC